MLGLYYIKETGVGAPDVEMDMLYFMLRMSLQLGGEGDEHAGSNYRPMQHIQGVKAIGATEFASGTGKTSLRGVKGCIETYWIEKWWEGKRTFWTGKIVCSRSIEKGQGGR